MTMVTEQRGWQYGPNAFTSTAHSAAAFGLTTTVIINVYKELLLRIFPYPVCYSISSVCLKFKPCLLCGAVSGHYCFHPFVPAYLMEELQWVRGGNRSKHLPLKKPALSPLNKFEALERTTTSEKGAESFSLQWIIKYWSLLFKLNCNM